MFWAVPCKKTFILHIRSLSGARLALVGLTDQLVHGKIPGALLGSQRVCGLDCSGPDQGSWRQRDGSIDSLPSTNLIPTPQPLQWNNTRAITTHTRTGFKAWDTLTWRR